MNRRPGGIRPRPEIDALRSHPRAPGGVPLAGIVVEQGPSARNLGPASVVQVFPWWLYPYASARYWYAKALNVAVGANSTQALTGFTFTVGPQNVGVVKQITMTVINSLAGIDLSLNLLLNGAPLEGFTGLAFPPVASTGQTIALNDLNIQLAQGQVLTATATEASGTGYTMSVNASGWQVPLNDVQRLQGAINY